MRKLLITLDNDLDDWLKTQINQSDTVRKALMIYKGDISTEVGSMVAGLRTMYGEFQEMKERNQELYDLVESTHNTIEELSSR